MKTIRLVLLVLVTAGGFVAAAFFPLLPRWTKAFLTRTWAKAMLAALGVELRYEGEPHRGAALIVANHISWLDILAISALRPALFVCKSEVAGWPARGWLLRRAGTIFLRRGSAKAADQTVRAAAAHLREGQSVAVFPEGTSTDGRRLLPFHGALFQAAVEAGCPVQPLALRYSSAAAVYAGDTAFGDSLMAVVGERELVVSVVVLPAVEAAERRAAARHTHALISANLTGGAVPGSLPAPPQPDAPTDQAEGGLATLQAGGQGLV